MVYAFRTPTSAASGSITEPVGTTNGDILIGWAEATGVISLPASWNLLGSYIGGRQWICGWIPRGPSAPSLNFSGGALTTLYTIIQPGNIPRFTFQTNAFTHPSAGAPIVWNASGLPLPFDAILAGRFATGGNTYSGTITPTLNLGPSNGASTGCLDWYGTPSTDGPFSTNNGMTNTGGVVMDQISVFLQTPPPPAGGNLPLLGVG